MIKHFNKGVVFGRLSDLKEKTADSENKTRYLQLNLECPNELHGDTKIYGRLWGDDRIDNLLKTLNQNGKLMKGTALRLEGFFGQYDGEDNRRLNNYTFFKWKLINSAEYRAAFILTGEIHDVYAKDGECCVHLHIIRSGANSKEIEEDFVLFTEDEGDVAGFKKGETVHLKGVISEKGREDYFGGTSGSFKAYIKEIKILGEVAAK